MQGTEEGAERKLYSLSEPLTPISLPLWSNDEDLYMQLSLLGVMKAVQCKTKEDQLDSQNEEIYKN